MFWNIITIENTKNLGRSLLWVELIFLALLVISIFVFLGIAIQSVPNGVTITDEDLKEIPRLITWPDALDFVVRFVGEGNVGEILLIIFVGAVTAQEYTWRTFRLWLSRGIPRSLLMAAKLTAILLPTLMIVITGLVVGGAITAIFSVQINGALGIDQVDFWQLGQSVLVTTYSLLPYGALAFLLAIAFRSAVVSVGGGLVYTMLIETFVVGVLASFEGRLGLAAKMLPVSLTASLARSAEPGLLDPLPAAIGIGLWTLALVCLAGLIFRRQDFTG